MNNTDKESSGGSDAFLEAEILKNSLSNEEIQLRAVATCQMELNQHGATTLRMAIIMPSLFTRSSLMDLVYLSI